MIRRVVIALVCLAAGAVMNVSAVIVLSCIAPPVDLMHPHSEVFAYSVGISTHYVMVHKRFGTNTLHSSLMEPHMNQAVGSEAALRARLPWIRPTMVQSGGEITARGWPRRAAWFESSMRPATFGQPARGGWVTPLPAWRSSLGVAIPRVIPYTPIFRGIVINTLFYAALLWMTWMMIIAVRNARRRRKGLCPGCAYDLRGADHVRCPECGAGRRPVASA